jgi:hypothetical protein
MGETVRDIPARGRDGETFYDSGRAASQRALPDNETRLETDPANDGPVSPRA